MPASPASKHLFYTEMAKLLGAGFDIRRAAGVMRNTKLPPAHALLLRDLESGLDAGETIAESFSRDARATGGLERSMIAAGERGGKLGPAFGHLAEYFGMVAAARRELIRGMIYPLVILHLGIFIGSVPLSIMGAERSAGQVAGGFGLSLLVLYSSAAILFFLGKRLMVKARENAALDRALNRIPWIGPARKNMAMARFCKVYHACLLAAIPMVETVRVSAASAQSGTILRAGKSLAATAAEGQALGPAFIAQPAFPATFSRSYATGEEAGTLDSDMESWARLFQENAAAATRTASVMIPKALYFLIMAFVAWKIIGFFTGYYSELDSLVE